MGAIFSAGFFSDFHYESKRSPCHVFDVTYLLSSYKKSVTRRETNKDQINLNYLQEIRGHFK